MTLRLALAPLRRALIQIPRPIPLSLHRPLSTTPSHLTSTPMAAPTDSVATQNTHITPESLTATLESKLNTTHVAVEDMSGGCGQAFNAIIVSPEFEKKTLLQRHRLVNAALKEEIAAIHAWTPRCLTEGQWEKEKEREREERQ